MLSCVRSCYRSINVKSCLLIYLIVSWPLITCAKSETLSQALGNAYLLNAELAAQRADTRAVDESLPGALADYRPSVSGNADAGLLKERYIFPGSPNLDRTSRPAGASVQVSVNLFNGFQTSNKVSQAMAQIMYSREYLRYTELSVLANGVQSYMHVLRDSAVVTLREDNLKLLKRQVVDTQDRVRLGEVTETDLAQTSAALAQAKIELVNSLSNLAASKESYKQVIGVVPASLSPAKPLVKLLPQTLQEARMIANADHPLITAASHNVETAKYAVKIAAGELLPSVSLTGTLGRRNDYAGVQKQRYNEGLVVGQLSVPIYDGGATYSRVRGVKEKETQAQAQLDQQRAQVLAQVGASWAAWQNSHLAIAASLDQVTYAEAALAGVREEARLGQRTTLDILNAQQLLVNARITLINTQHDQVISSYSLLASMGHLSAETLSLSVLRYSAQQHLDKVQNKWFGLTP